MWWSVHPLWLCFTLLWPIIRVASGAGNNSTIAEAFPQLSNLQRYPASRFRLSAGAQDLDHCCLLAVNDSLSVVNGTVTGFKENQSFISDSFTSFRNRQFPCAATYIGDKQGAPAVTISYSYCRTNCPGWQRSKSAKLNQWVSPFVGFIVPAVVFCLAIPRRRKIYLPERLIDVKLNELMSSPFVIPPIAIAAVVLAIIDTICWLLTIFALSGPIIVSGIYEAFLDNRLLQYLQENLDHFGLSPAERAHILYTILVGNIDMTAVPETETSNIENPDVWRNNAWNHIDNYPGDPHGLGDGRHDSLLKELRQRTDDDTYADRTKTHLRTMLASQYSFAVTVGAPVVFFCASFIYALIENYSNYGDNDTSHALAFGMWWMTIPHIAVVSSLLLAGNNPNTLEGVVGQKSADPAKRKWYIFELVYESRYRPAWIWDRGRNKRIWAMRLQKTHHQSTDDKLKDKIAIGPQDWFTIFLFTFGLIVIPSILAFLTSFYTPRVGLSCRSMTFLVYVLCQLCLILLWIWNIQSAELVENFEPYVPVTRIPWREKAPEGASGKPWWYSGIWYLLVIPAASGAIFTAIGGTMMQIIGVYRNCLCDIPITVWSRRYDQELLIISTNSQEDIHRAITVWTRTGATAVAVLGIVSFVGWWYQKRLRHQFRKLILDITKERTPVEMREMNGNPSGGNFNKGVGGVLPPAPEP